MTDLKPEQRAREWIDRKLEDAGWKVINRDEYAPGMTAVAVREAAMRGGLEADYLLLINGKAAAVLEAKREEISLSNPHLIAQAENYTKQVKPWYPTWLLPLPFVYLSNGKEIAFKDCRKPNAKYEIITKFPRPWDLVRRLHLGEFDGLLYLSPKGLRKCQYEALNNLEASFKDGKRRAVMVLATGSGKTFTACMMAYRMLSFTPMKHVLFLVDRNNLGTAAATELKTFKLTESGKPLSEIFWVEQLTNRPIDPRTRIVVSTIQRLYSLLTGNTDSYSEEDEDAGMGHHEGDVVELPANPTLPPDFFDLIIIDECHRSIYSDWQKVLTYFNRARLVGMTATPIPETLAFFDNNRVANYTYEQSVLDDVNVSFRIYRIKTELTEEGGTIETGDKLEVTNRLDAKRHQQVAIEERAFSKADLNRRVVVRDQIRKVLQEYKDAVYTQFYPEREPNFDYLPKTLIFALSDAHAQLIVEVAKEVFNRTDDHFVQKITYSIGNSNERIKQFRYDVNFRIAVTVTLVATGTDVRPLEVLIFFNDVHSETLYAQMKGRGCRTITPSQLQAVTPNAKSKELFYIVDAVGVTESEKYVPSLDGNDGPHPINPTLEALFEQMALGHLPDDYFHLLASKLSCIGNRADPEDLQEYAEFSPISPLTWAKTIMDALDKGNLPPFVSASHENRERMAVVHDLLTNIPARKKLVEIAKGYVKEILGKTDSVVSAGFSMENAKASTMAFEEYVRAHRDDIEALRLIYNEESGKITRAAIDDLAKYLSMSLPGFHVGRLWNDYALICPDKVTPLRSDQQAVTDLIQLVRYAFNMIDSLYTLTSLTAQRFELWCGQVQRSITTEQKELFRKIAFYIAQNGSCELKGLIQIMPVSFASAVRRTQRIKNSSLLTNSSSRQHKKWLKPKSPKHPSSKRSGNWPTSWPVLESGSPTT